MARGGGMNRLSALAVFAMNYLGRCPLNLPEMVARSVRSPDFPSLPMALRQPLPAPIRKVQPPLVDIFHQRPVFAATIQFSVPHDNRASILNQSGTVTME